MMRILKGGVCRGGGLIQRGLIHEIQLVVTFGEPVLGLGEVTVATLWAGEVHDPRKYWVVVWVTSMTTCEGVQSHEIVKVGEFTFDPAEDQLR